MKSKQQPSNRAFDAAQTRAASTTSTSGKKGSSSSSSSNARRPTPAAAADNDDRGYDADAESDSLTESDEQRKGGGKGRKAAAARAAAEDEAETSSSSPSSSSSSFSSTDFSSSSSWPGSDVEDEDDASKSAEEDDEEEESHEEKDPAASLRAALFEEALAKVPELGWTQEALAAAAVSLGLSASAARLARRGPADLALWFIRRSNDEFAASLGNGFVVAPSKEGEEDGDEKVKNDDESDNARLRELRALPGTTARIDAAIWWRLQPVARFSSTWHQAVASIALAGPRAAAEAARELWRWSDDAWTLAAGDRTFDPSSSSSYYSKRATLSAVYAACELHLLADFSPNHEETRLSIRRRLEDAAAVARFSKTVLGAVSPASSSSFGHFAAGAASRAREAACGPMGMGRGGGRRGGGAEWEGGGGV